MKRSASSGGPYAQVATPIATTHNDGSLANGSAYFHVVTAVDAVGESASSVEVSATPAAVTVVPAAPTGLAAASGNTQVTLKWSASSGAAGYKVKRSNSSSGSYTQIATPAANSYVDTSLSNGTSYYYVVSAVMRSAKEHQLGIGQPDSGRRQHLSAAWRHAA